MKRMTLLSLVLVGSIACGLASAQPAPGQRPDPGAHLQNLSVILELSPQQQAQLGELLDARHAQREARREAGREAREQKREARRADHEAFEQQLLAILDEQQQAKFAAMKAKRHSRRDRRRGQHAERHGEG